MKLKPGVQMRALTPQCLFAMLAAEECFKALGAGFTITSIDGDNHSARSKHWSGAAFDARTRDISETEQQAIEAELKRALGVDFDVVLEDDHLHVEWDPKGRHK